MTGLDGPLDAVAEAVALLRVAADEHERAGHSELARSHRARAAALQGAHGGGA